MRKKSSALLGAFVLASLASCEKVENNSPAVKPSLKGSQEIVPSECVGSPWNPCQYLPPSAEYFTYENDTTERPTLPKYDVPITEYTSFITPPEEPEAGYSSLNYLYPNTSAAPLVTYQFESSINIGSEGPPASTSSSYMKNYNMIWDLVILKSGSANVAAAVNYHKIPVNLNSGAGGKKIYISFSRTHRVESGTGQISKYFASDPTLVNGAPLRGIETQSFPVGRLFPNPPANYLKIYNVNWNASPNVYSQVDLNDGARGKYIYAFQTRSNVGRFNPIKEIGVLAGNSSGIMPPSGWIKHPQDLNEGASGDYVYLCYKY